MKSYEDTGDPWSLDYAFYNNGDWALKKKITWNTPGDSTTWELSASEKVPIHHGFTSDLPVPSYLQV